MTNTRASTKAPSPTTGLDRVDPWTGTVSAPIARVQVRIDTRDPWTPKVSDADVEAALVKALVAATDAGRFEVVAQLAHDLESRRLAKQPLSAAPSTGAVVRILDRDDPWR